MCMASKSIPKIIHYCWFGGAKKPELVQKCIKSWEKYCPDYKIVEWNERNFDVKMNPYIKEAYERGQWAFVADFARLLAVYEHGGVYLDTDVELIKNLDDVLGDKAFYCLADNTVATGLGFGAIKKHPSVKQMLMQYDGIHFIDEKGRIDTTPCPVRNTKALEEYVGQSVEFSKKTLVGDVCIYPDEYFSPLDYDTHELNITDKTYAIHWYGESWLSEKKKRAKALKRVAARIIGKKNFVRIRKMVKGY